MLFALDSDPARSPYDNLSDLCTMLIIAEEGPDFSLLPLFHTINETLKKGGKDGDVVVMATRALALILDKFSRCISQLCKANTPNAVRKCFENVFAMVKKRQVTLKQEKTTMKELKEELLNCLSLAGNCAEIAGVVPSTEEQLGFCLSALDDTKWTSCKVLRHCIGLMRRGELKNAGDFQAVEHLMHHNLTALCHLDIDHEWDELLRTAVEGMLTYRVWCAACVPQESQEMGRKRKRSSKTDAATSTTTTSPSASSNGVSRKNLAEALLEIGERIASSGTAESRVQLTLACLASVLEVASIPLEANERALGWLAVVLQQNASRVAGFSSPFAHNRQRATKQDQLWPDTFQALPNLQWIVPPVLCSALVLLAKLCGADFGFRCEYMWAWRGDGDDYYPYTKSTRRRLTAMFFAAETTRKVLQTRHIIDLRAMTDTSALTLTVSRIHFQPIPSVVVFDGKLVIPPEAIQLSGKVSTLLQEALRALSFGHSQTSALARAIRLYVICSVPPTSTEDVVAAFRSLPAEHKRSVVEEISTTLLQRDKGWAPALLEAGVADALTVLPATTAAKEVATTVARPKHIPPIAELIRSAGSSPQLTPVKLTKLADLPGFLRHASSSELLAFVEELESLRVSEKNIRILCADIEKDSRLAVQVRSAVHTYVLRALHQISVAQREVKGLMNKVCDASHIISICRSEETKANRAQCPNGHPLLVHFSVKWRCDSCMTSNAFGSLACRECNYDLCSDCSNAKLSRMDVSATAVVGDVIRAWRECLVKENSGEAASDGKAAQSAFLFTPKGVLPASRPASTLIGEDVHFSETSCHCCCNISVPSFIAGSVKDVTEIGYPLQLFLRTFGKQQHQGDIEPAIVNALESCGVEIFEKGLAGIPVRVSHVLEAMSPFLSLPFKRDTAHFLAVGCRRFGLYHLQDVNATVRGTVVGDISSNGLATKVTVSRDTEVMTQALFKAFLQYPTLRNKVEFNFEGEEGTGEGPTQELYAELSQRYRGLTTLWHKKDDGSYVPFPTLERVCLEEFFVLGACCGRAFADGYTMDVDLLPLAWPFIRSQSPSEKAKWNLLTELEPVLAHSYGCMLNATDMELEQMGVEDEESGTLLTMATVKAYVTRCVEERLENALMNLHWFALGISSVIDLDAFWFLSDDEMSIVVCGASREDPDERLFGEEELRTAVMEAHGYTPGSREVAMLISIVGAEFTREQQKFFIEFLTGSSRLPLNGLAGLGRKITVVRKEMDGKGEQMLPSCNTCFLYFKLPPYSSHAIMKSRLLTAITEGRRNFSLS
ncbi:putative ubiquitin-protein ligase [Trypanosoma grayi]|uniref:putative ubiquitin-protein ligase n=1 Tax=Trypanosoma grayi TaxID=71804 RepID=UPI0004F4B4B9|nr:putative ubiquitin-protein ligase [Trypanosoma grayi]KEG11362.1 putative ubiquitin-protein ligase [Trypanosoma grayi]